MVQGGGQDAAVSVRCDLFPFAGRPRTAGLVKEAGDVSLHYLPDAAPILQCRGAGH